MPHFAPDIFENGPHLEEHSLDIRIRQRRSTQFAVLEGNLTLGPSEPKRNVVPQVLSQRRTGESSTVAKGGFLFIGVMVLLAASMLLLGVWSGTTFNQPDGWPGFAIALVAGAAIPLLFAILEGAVLLLSFRPSKDRG